MSPSIKAGHQVRVRGARWRIVDVHTYAGCQVVTLRGLAPPQFGLERRVISPFDIIERVDRLPAPRRVRPARWRRACRALLAAEGPPGSLRAARSARIDLLPYQLEPALAVLRGLGTRLLLADEVGLGKTIQAGLVASELLARGSIDRMLVLAPPGLRDQWAEELGDRFALGAVSVDGRTLRQLAASLPIGVNPWLTLPAAIASIDYVKRPEVRPAVTSCRWDLVIVDEAHGSAGDSDRRATVHALASRAAYVLLLSATPHNGDRESFASLCDLGAIDAGHAAADAPLLVFRRTRADAGIGTKRRVHTLRVSLSTDERRMHALLTRYSDAVRAECDHNTGEDEETRDAWLALSVLHKRALSSAWSLAQSVERRLADGSLPPETSGILQLTLPLGDPDGERMTADEAPAWPVDLRLSDPARERRLLTALAASARTASNNEAKLAALDKLLRRARESAVVFTEYRDTLLHIANRLARPALLLHGGLSREERAAALAEFSHQPRALLLATDAAAEGLNLHRGCRLVVNMDLPWNPMRLEQRIGRVDRIGQRRIVHAFHLIAEDTGETRLLARLRARVAVAQADIGAPDPLGDDEREIARLVIRGDAHDDGHTGGSPGRSGR